VLDVVSATPADDPNYSIVTVYLLSPNLDHNGNAEPYEMLAELKAQANHQTSALLAGQMTQHLQVQAFTSEQTQVVRFETLYKSCPGAPPVRLELDCPPDPRAGEDNGMGWLVWLIAPTAAAALFIGMMTFMRSDRGSAWLKRMKKKLKVYMDSNDHALNLERPTGIDVEQGVELMEEDHKAALPSERTPPGTTLSPTLSMIVEQNPEPPASLIVALPSVPPPLLDNNEEYVPDREYLAQVLKLHKGDSLVAEDHKYISGVIARGHARKSDPALLTTGGVGRRSSNETTIGGESSKSNSKDSDGGTESGREESHSHNFEPSRNS